jgi:hypothetical protein
MVVTWDWKGFNHMGDVARRRAVQDAFLGLQENTIDVATFIQP